ncbi:hypothetical protein [Bradyrhizobium sp.]|jgi:hypothetical protein|uniref:hypothetical protein n=2 Tax=Bradyrhizobium sp. TaxID=376 RepID=UPI003C4DC467
MSLVQTMKNTIRNISQNPTEAVAQAEQRIVELQADREQKLIDAEGDYLEAIAAIDEQIRTLQASVVVHRDRIAAQAVKRARQERKRLEDEKTAFIAEVKKLIPRRQASAARIDAASKEAASAFAELAATDDAIFLNWPEVMPRIDSLGYLRAMRIDVLSPSRKQKMMAGLVREIVNRGPFNIAEEVEKRGRELVNELDGRTDEAAA